MQTIKTAGTTSEDVCSSNTLTEYFCNGDQIESEIIDCTSLGDYICNSGKCVNS